MAHRSRTLWVQLSAYGGVEGFPAPQFFEFFAGHFGIINFRFAFKDQRGRHHRAYQP